jgi:hypothetical protein
VGHGVGDERPLAQDEEGACRARRGARASAAPTETRAGVEPDWRRSAEAKAFIDGGELGGGQAAAVGGLEVAVGEGDGDRPLGEDAAVEEKDAVEVVGHGREVVVDADHGLALRPAGISGRPMIDSSVAASTPAKGSSRRKRSAPWARARARKTRCCWPPESWPIWRCARSSGAGAVEGGLGAGAVVGPHAPEEPELTVEAHERHVDDADREVPVHRGALGDVGQAVALPGERLAEDRDLSRLAGTRPSAALRSVDFPAPLGPTMAVSERGATVMSTSSSAGLPS